MSRECRSGIGHARLVHFLLKLGDRCHSVDEQSPVSITGKLWLADDGDGNIILPQHLQELAGLQNLARDAIEAMHQDSIDLAILDVFNETIQGWPIQRLRGLANVIVSAINKLPPLSLHGCCEYEADFVLCIARCEFDSRLT